MANGDHVAQLDRGVAVWNAWRYENITIRPDLSSANLREEQLGEADLRAANLTSANLIGANLSGAHFSGANLFWANLSGANLRKANLLETDLRWANLSGADLSGADLSGANLSGANLVGVNLTRADLQGANLTGANLTGAILARANLARVNLTGAANLTRANLTNANLQFAALVDTNLTDADLTNCRIHGVSAWRLKLKGTTQQNLMITREDEPAVTVDDIEVAQFIYLLLHNPKIRDVIDTIGRKAVLILGRFTPERKAVLDALRKELRERYYVPILFDFDKPASQDLTATVSTLAHLARFIIADLSDPSSIAYELATVVPTTPIPVQPILLSGCSEFAMFQDLQRRYHWVLPTHRYDSPGQLIAEIDARVIRPAETKVLELRGP
jgi:uncharacterized protein YjbI with pentapeptide repeats